MYRSNREYTIITCDKTMCMLVTCLTIIDNFSKCRNVKRNYANPLVSRCANTTIILRVRVLGFLFFLSFAQLQYALRTRERLSERVRM